MSASVIVFAVRWLMAPLLALVAAYWLSGRFHDATSFSPTIGEKGDRAFESGSVDPLEAWSQAQIKPDLVDRLAESWSASRYMTADDFIHAYKHAKDEGDRGMILSLGEAWAQRDPESLLNFVQIPKDHIGPFSAERALIEIAYVSWARRDAKAAFERLAEDGPISTSVMNEVAICFLSEDPTAVSETFALVKSHVSDRFRLHDFLGRPTPKTTFSGDVEKLARSLEELPSGAEANAFAKMIGESILTDSPNETSNDRFWKWWQALSSTLQVATLPEQTRQTPDTIHAPKETRTRFAELAEADHQLVPAYMRYFGAEWAAEAPDDAFAWVLDRYDGVALPGPTTYWMSGSIAMFGSAGESRQFEDALREPIRVLAQRDPQLAMNALTDIVHLGARSKMAVEIAQTWAQTQPVEALRWATTLPAEQIQSNAIRASLTEWAEADLDAATDYCLQHYSKVNGNHHIGAITNAVERQGHLASARWVASQPEDVIEYTLGHFVSRPPQTDRLRPFQKALDQLPSSSGKDRILSLIHEWTHDQ